MSRTSTGMRLDGRRDLRLLPVAIAMWAGELAASAVCNRANPVAGASPGARVWTASMMPVLLVVFPVSLALLAAMIYARRSLARIIRTAWRGTVPTGAGIVLLVDREGRIEFIIHVEDLAGQRFVGESAGDFIDAATAKQEGLVNRVVSLQALDAEVAQLVQSILEKPRAAVAMGKALVYRQRELGLEAAYQLAGQTMAVNMMDAAAQEGARAFAEKRKPDWKC